MVQRRGTGGMPSCSGKPTSVLQVDADHGLPEALEALCTKSEQEDGGDVPAFSERGAELHLLWSHTKNPV